MKLLCVTLLVMAMLSASFASADPVVEEKNWTTTYPVDNQNPRLTIDNIWGDIRVRAGASNQITVTIHEHRLAASQSDFAQSKTLIPLIIDADKNAVAITVGNRDRWRKREQNRCRGCRVEYDFDIVAPADTNLYLDTVLDGEISVDGIHGEVNASNVNGPVTIHGLHQCGSIESINDALDLVFSQTPVSDCHIDNLNGDTSVSLPANTNADATFRLHNGTIHSEFELTPQASAPTVSRYQRDGRQMYRVEQKPGVQIGNGGATLHFFSLNGDIRLLKQ